MEEQRLSEVTEVPSRGSGWWEAEHWLGWDGGQSRTRRDPRETSSSPDHLKTHPTPSQVQAMNVSSRFEEEIKAEQEERKKQAEEMKQRKAAFKELQSTFK